MVVVAGSSPVVATIKYKIRHSKKLEIIGLKKDNEIIDLQTAEELKLDIDNYQKIYFDNSKDALSIIRHSCAHLMAQAIKQLYTNAKFFVGPVVDEGFYYDFKVDEKISIEDLAKIESKMRELAKQSSPIKKEYMDRSKALEKFKDDELKMTVIKNIKEDTFSTYKQNDFEDLCRGPHIPDVKFLSHFKLTKLAGAYLGGNENEEMLTRIYGIAFATKEALKEYNFMMEEALKRDHRKIGNELQLFTFDEDIGAGFPIWLPKGARIRRNIENILTRALINQEYEPVRGPEILKSDLWKISGHYQNYKENMYFTTIDETEYGIKPMNCLGHIKVYQSDIRSYRDLPLRFYEYGVVHRHEKSGVLHGLLRVREFTQDDAHIFCKQDQIKDEIITIVNFVSKIMKIFDFKCNIPPGLCIYASGLGFSTRLGAGLRSSFRLLFFCSGIEHIGNVHHDIRLPPPHDGLEVVRRAVEQHTEKVPGEERVCQQPEECIKYSVQRHFPYVATFHFRCKIRCYPADILPDIQAGGCIHQMSGIPVDLHHDKKRKRRLLDELLKVDVHEPGQFLYRRGVLEQYLLYARGKGLYYVPEDGMEHPLLCPEVIMKSRTCDSGRRSNVTHTCLVETLQDKKRLCRLDNPSLLQGAVLWRLRRRPPVIPRLHIRSF